MALHKEAKAIQQRMYVFFFFNKGGQNNWLPKLKKKKIIWIKTLQLSQKLSQMDHKPKCKDKTINILENNRGRI